VGRGGSVYVSGFLSRPSPIPTYNNSAHDTRYALPHIYQPEQHARLSSFILMTISLFHILKFQNVDYGALNGVALMLKILRMFIIIVQTMDLN